MVLKWGYAYPLGVLEGTPGGEIYFARTGRGCVTIARIPPLPPVRRSGVCYDRAPPSDVGTVAGQPRRKLQGLNFVRGYLPEKIFNRGYITEKRLRTTDPGDTPQA